MSDPLAQVVAECDTLLKMVLFCSPGSSTPRSLADLN